MFLHADIQGAAATVVKGEGNEIPQNALEEAAQFAAAYSKAWQSGLPSADVYAVKPDQVSKTPPSGMSIGKGSFMIYGQRQWFRKTPLAFAVGAEKLDGNFSVIAGPPSAVKKRATAFVMVKQGGGDKNAAAKKVLAILEKKLGQKTAIELDDIASALPGECSVQG
jgi:hypothetical protein